MFPFIEIEIRPAAEFKPGLKTDILNQLAGRK